MSNKQTIVIGDKLFLELVKFLQNSIDIKHIAFLKHIQKLEVGETIIMEHFTTAGSYQWTAPAGVSEIMLDGIGGDKNGPGFLKIYWIQPPLN